MPKNTLSTYRIILEIEVDDNTCSPGPNHPQVWDWDRKLGCKAKVIEGQFLSQRPKPKERPDIPF